MEQQKIHEDTWKKKSHSAFEGKAALRKNLCKNNQPQKNDFVVRAADRSLSFLFQYKLNTAVCQAPDAKYPDATERRVLKIKPCKRNNHQNSDHTKNAANKATLRSDPTQAAE